MPRYVESDGHVGCLRCPAGQVRNREIEFAGQAEHLHQLHELLRLRDPAARHRLRPQQRLVVVQRMVREPDDRLIQQVELARPDHALQKAGAERRLVHVSRKPLSEPSLRQARRPVAGEHAERVAERPRRLPPGQPVRHKWDVMRRHGNAQALADQGSFQAHGNVDQVVAAAHG